MRGRRSIRGQPRFAAERESGEDSPQAPVELLVGVAGESDRGKLCEGRHLVGGEGVQGIGGNAPVLGVARRTAPRTRLGHDIPEREAEEQSVSRGRSGRSISEQRARRRRSAPVPFTRACGQPPGAGERPPRMRPRNLTVSVLPSTTYCTCMRTTGEIDQRYPRRRATALRDVGAACIPTRCSRGTSSGASAARCSFQVVGDR